MKELTLEEYKKLTPKEKTIIAVSILNGYIAGRYKKGKRLYHYQIKITK